ncbi:MAG TPA: DNA polymerase III subunit epsilon [Devosiaceae bacterium]|nr:DNA polymerase III subunit epsilon [Devosiaceae bacterium]
MADREIVLDTETTGLSPQQGDRLVEIGCIELLNHVPTGEKFHRYVNPERDMPDDAFRVHGLSAEFLAGHRLFVEEAGDFLEFLADSTLIIHNASFDLGFLSAELEKVGRPGLANPVIDTVALARKVHPGARVSLDALCKHYGIDNSRRALHGALLDAEILAEVYLELIGGRQVAMSLGRQQWGETGPVASPAAPAGRRPMPLRPRLAAAEVEAHVRFMAGFGKNAIWRRYENGD